MNLYIVLGYLASGKTTFVKNFLNNFKDKKNAVIVNDFGGKDVDGIILQEYTNNLKSIYDGSIFCSCKSDMFANAILELSELNPDNIIVEASGLANPYTMVNAINGIRNKCNNVIDIKGVVSLVDTKNFEKIYTVCNSIKMQIACSDIILLNKIDLADNNAINRVKNIVVNLNKNAVIKETVNSFINDYNFNIVEKELPNNIQDLTVQKLLLTIKENTDIEKVDEMCYNLNTFCHRVKGILSFNNNYYVYEYIDGKSKIIKTTEKGNYLILLSALKENLKIKTEQIISKYNFAVIEK